MKKLLLIMVVLALTIMGVNAPAFAGGSQSVDVRASVPTISGGLSLAISRIRASDNGWEKDQPSIDFQALTLDPQFHVFRPKYTFVVDVGVTDNSGSAWTITHTANSVLKDATNNLDSNINVAFVKQTSDTTSVDLKKVSYAASSGTAYTKAQLTGGWLRIYYGIGTGLGDAPGVLPIGEDKPAGQYSGSVVITLAP